MMKLKKADTTEKKSVKFIDRFFYLWDDDYSNSYDDTIYNDYDIFGLGNLLGLGSEILFPEWYPNKPGSKPPVVGQPVPDEFWPQATTAPVDLTSVLLPVDEPTVASVNPLTDASSVNPSTDASSVNPPTDTPPEAPAEAPTEAPAEAPIDTPTDQPAITK